MNIKNIVVGLVVAVVGTWGSMGCAQTQETPQPIQVETIQPIQVDQPVAVEVGNKKCPVSGEEVGKMGDIVKYEYNGKIYNLCCSACIKDFSGDPEKYSKIAEDEVASAKGVQADESAKVSPVGVIE